MSILVVVNCLMRSVAVLFLALWVPVTMHCDLEAIPLFKFLACCAHSDAAPHQDNDCNEDACSTVESGGYQIQTNPPPAHPPILTVVIGAASLNDLAPLQPTTWSLPVPPPELPASWQFLIRAAPSVRAPGFAS